MAMDLLLKTPSVVEDKNLQEAAGKGIEEILQMEKKSAMEGESFLRPPSSNQKTDSNVSNSQDSRSNGKTCGGSNMKMDSEKNHKEFISIDKVAQIESAKAEMREVREENERLKTTLRQIMKDYQELQMQIFEMVHQKENIKKLPLEKTPLTDFAVTYSTNSEVDSEETHDLVSLSLGNGRTSILTPTKKDENKTQNIDFNSDIKYGRSTNVKEGDDDDESSLQTGLSLGLDCNFLYKLNDGNNPTDNSSEGTKLAEDAGEGWPAAATEVRRTGDDAIASHHVKRARVTVRAKCDAPTMQDGCQWRKYGQKIAKGNPCPRAYYRCTVARGCGVRKQVQRCAEDMSILITTYEGTHNHPLPLQATAMASTTAAAASMLMSGSSVPAAGTSATYGLTFDRSDHSLSTRPFCLTNPAMPTAPACPTITLDLTSTSSAPQFTRQLPSAFSTTAPWQPPSVALGGSNFSFSTDQTTLPSSWNGIGNTKTSFLNYGAQQLMNKNLTIMQMATQSQTPEEQFYQNLSQKLHPSSASSSSSVFVPSSSSSSSKLNFSNTVAAATKAIASDPSFQSALAAAITSIVSTTNTSDADPHESINGGNVGQKIKWDVDQIPSSSSSSSAAAYSSSSGTSTLFNHRISSSGGNHQQAAGNLSFQLAPSLPFSSEKSTSAPPANNIIHGEKTK